MTPGKTAEELDKEYQQIRKGRMCVEKLEGMLKAGQS